ncbi:MAG: hypothetical protein IBX36_03080 [Dehalococcoidia bacterium]|nr:hypothetical protein [Dehalococcoidia bacterium]
MKSEDEIQRQLACWDGVVAAFRRDLIQGRKVPKDEFDKVTQARFRIQDLVWVLGEGKGGKASRRFRVSTDVLLELFGDADAGDGETYVDKYNASFDRNSRYRIRKKLLEEAVKEIGGYIS